VTVHTRTILLWSAVAATLFLTACSASGSQGESSETAAPGGELTVFAAASLTGTFTELAAQFEEDHPGVTVDLNFDGSSGLATQLIEGAPADVFAAASTSTMQQVVDEGLITATPEVFVTNVLEIAVPAGNPAGIESFADLAEPAVKLVICAEEVPCGAATVTIEENTGIELDPVSEEQTVTDVLGKVASGEADAGLVYVTDVIGAEGEVDGVPFPESADVVNEYPIAALANASPSGLAVQFVELILGPEGQAVLGEAGFTPAQ